MANENGSHRGTLLLTLPPEDQPRQPAHLPVGNLGNIEHIYAPWYGYIVSFLAS